MNEREALLRAVCENPDDDTPRLVFADWLQEHGDEARAEFIRVQVGADRNTLRGRHRGPYDSRSVQLLAEHERRWRTELTEDRGLYWGTFNRGFVDKLYIHRDRCRLPFEYFPLVLDTTPVQDFGLTGVINCREFLTWPSLARLTMLEFYAIGWPDDDWRRLADCPALRDGLGLLISVDYPSDATRARLESRFSVDYCAS
jgi:uncharacterized protein (TIGR02996 family)